MENVGEAINKNEQADPALGDTYIHSDRPFTVSQLASRQASPS